MNKCLLWMLLASIPITHMSLMEAMNVAHASTSTEEASDDCTICFDESSDALRVLYCGHTFHEGCIEGWKKVAVHKVCPDCNHPITYLRDYKCSLCNEKFKDEGNPFVRLKCDYGHIFHASCLLKHCKSSPDIKKCPCPCAAQGCTKEFNMYTYPLLSALKKQEDLARQQELKEAEKLRQDEAQKALVNTMQARLALQGAPRSATGALKQPNAVKPSVYGWKSGALDGTVGTLWGFMAHQILEDPRMSANQKMAALAMLIASLGGISGTLDNYTPARRAAAIKALALMGGGIVTGYHISKWTNQSDRDKA